MATTNSSQVRELRDVSGAPMMDCKKALDETAGDMDKAMDWLRKKGMASAAKKAGRTAADGAVFSYIHHNGKVGVLLEVNCETDFVARSEPYQLFCRDVCLHIASMRPQYVRREDVPAEIVEHEREIAQAQVDSKKPREIQEKMIEGRVAKYFAETCLMEQAFVKDDKRSVEQLRTELVGKLGENIVVRRFARFEVGAE
ncbi:MAG TPA: translation elongation factor Ts [Planctomycetota bacterium]|nr:translation elongation factor Ts [Planctomycetota bacterium]